MIPIVSINIEKPEPHYFKFIHRLTIESFIQDIKYLLFQLNGVSSLTQQKDRVLFISFAIDIYLNECRYQILDFNIQEWLEGIEKFILIKNKTISDFSMEVQIKQKPIFGKHHFPKVLKINLK